MGGRSGPSRRPIAAGPVAPDGYGDAIEEAKRRRRMMSGLWRTDLERVLSNLINPRQVRSWGHGEKLDLAKNLLRSVVCQLAILYDRPPVISHEDPEAAEMLRTIVDRAGLWQLMAELQQLTIAQREGFILVHPTELGGKPGVTFEVIPRDLFHAEALPENPDEPVRAYVYRIREVDGDDVWTRDCWDIADPENPVYRIETDAGELLPLPTLTGDAYRWRYSDGLPFVPGELYHAKRTGALFDAFRGIELVDGALRVAAYWCLFGHILRDASHPQRYCINANLDSVQTDASGDAYVVTDPSSVLMLRSQPGQTGAAGQWQPGGDPVVVGNAIRNYASDLAADFDLTPSDIQRSNGDARSGYAISLTSEGKRAAQRRFEPQFRRGDERLLGKVAAVLNSTVGAALPDTGWSIQYTGVPLTFEERRIVMQEFELRKAQGMISKPMALARLEDISTDQAREMLRQITKDNREFGE